MAQNSSFDLSQLGNMLKRLSAGQQLSLLLFVLLAIGGILAGSYYVGQESYQVLYSGMNPEDVGAVVTKLKEQKVPYRLDPGGTGVSVPVERIDEVRVQLAAGGLPQSGKLGFEVFDRTNFGMSEFTEKINFRRALEGELARSISSLTEVASARVHLVLPQTALFQEQEEKAKASVVVSLKTGRNMPNESIFGIGYLVASAVPGLKPENITIMDVRGNLLSLPSKGSLTPGLSQPEMETQLALEKELNDKILSILEPAFGKGKVTAKSSVELDLDRVEETAELYDPEKSAVTRRQVTRDSAGNGAPVGGVAGVGGNQPQTPQALLASTQNNDRSRQDENTNFEVSRTVRHTVQALGTIKKLSVAVMVDDKLVYTKDAKGQRVPGYVSRTPEELAKIRGLVVAAVGFKQERGDQITVENMPFQLLEVPVEEPPPTNLQRTWTVVQPYMRYVGVSMLVLLAYLSILRPLKRRVLDSLTMDTTREPGMLPGMVSGNGSEALLSGNMHPLPGGEQGSSPRKLLDLEKELDNKIEDELAVASLNADAKKTAAIKKRIMEMAKQQPEQTAQLIRTWVTRTP
jgi:flagellar M-ring protein FliF